MKRGYCEIYTRVIDGREVQDLRAVCACGHVDNPIRYSSGLIVWDFPERVPGYLKLEASRVYGQYLTRGAPLASDCLRLAS